jgi:hypothetical protein
MQSAGCQGKRQFLTFTEAKGAAKNATRNNGSPMRPYPCRHCHKFHIGNVPTHETKRLRERPESV